MGVISTSHTLLHTLLSCVTECLVMLGQKHDKAGGLGAQPPQAEVFLESKDLTEGKFMAGSSLWLYFW